MDVVVCAMKYYQEHIRGKIFILNMDHKAPETLNTLHKITMNCLQLAMIDFKFQLDTRRDRKCQQMFLSRSFMEIGEVSALDMNWAHK
jgi:hypothetical protein